MLFVIQFRKENKLNTSFYPKLLNYTNFSLTHIHDHILRVQIQFWEYFESSERALLGKFYSFFRSMTVKYADSGNQIKKQRIYTWFDIKL